MENSDRVWVLLAKKKTGEASGAELLELDRLMKQQELRGQTSEVIDKVWEVPLDVNPELRIDIQRDFPNFVDHFRRLTS